MNQSVSYNLLAISGSLRQDSFNTALARALSDIAPDGVSVSAITLHNIPHYNADEDGNSPPKGAKELREAITACDGLILVSPEYNYGMPGVLKNALDWASRPAFASVLKNKPVLIVTATPSPTGGARAHAQLCATLAGTLSRVVARRQLTIAGVDQKLEGGRLHRPDTIQFLRDSLINLVDEIKMVRSVPTYKVQ